MPDTRRDFVARTGLGALGAAALAAADIPRRPLGKTGLEVSVIGLGGARIGLIEDHKTAVEVVRRCYEGGINYFDTAASGAYGLSQARYGAALKEVRDRIVLGTKTRYRTATQAQIDLDQSLGFLKTDRIDLYQIHNVIDKDDMEAVFAPRGVMEMVEKARKAGKIRFVGFTGHTTPDVLNAMMGRYNFSTVLMPLGVADGANRAKSFEKETLPAAREKGLGVIAMKTLGVGRFLKQKTATLEECLAYVLSLPIATAIVGCDTVEQVAADLRIAAGAKPLAAAEMERLRRRFEGLELAQLEPWKGLPVAGGQPAGYRAD